MRFLSPAIVLSLFLIGSGAMAQEAVVSFTVVDGAGNPVSPSLTGITSSANLTLNQLPSAFTIRADLNGTKPGSVYFALMKNGKSAYTRTTDNSIPHYLCGHTRSLPNNCASVLQAGATAPQGYTLTATPYTGGNKTGVQGTPLTIGLSIASVPPPVVTVQAPSSLIQGQSGSLTWSATNATSATLNGSALTPGTGCTQGTLCGSASITSGSFSLTATGPGGQGSQTFNVAMIPLPTISGFALSTPSILQGQGQSATLSWSIGNFNPTLSTLSISGLGTVTCTGSPCNGSAQVSPSAPTSYQLVVTGPGTYTATQTVNLQVIPQPIASLTTQVNPIIQGQSAIVSWNVQNATSISISPTVGSQSCSGSPLVCVGTSVGLPLQQDTVFTLTATWAGPPVQVPLTIKVIPNPIVTLTSTVPTITQGQSTTLSWTAQNATTVTINNQSQTSGPGCAANTMCGTMIVTPDTTTTYTISASGLGGTTTQPFTIKVNPAQPVIQQFQATSQSINSGQSVGLTWQTQYATSVTLNGSPLTTGTGCSTGTWCGTFNDTPTTTTTYTLVATGPGGQTQQALQVTVIPPPAISVTQDSTGNTLTINVQGPDTQLQIDDGPLFTTPVYSQTLGSASSPITLSTLPSGLISGTTYYFKLLPSGTQTTFHIQPQKFNTSVSAQYFRNAFLDIGVRSIQYNAPVTYVPNTGNDPAGAVNPRWVNNPKWWAGPFPTTPPAANPTYYMSDMAYFVQQTATNTIYAASSSGDLVTLDEMAQLFNVLYANQFSSLGNLRAIAAANGWDASPLIGPDTAMTIVDVKPYGSTYQISEIYLANEQFMHSPAQLLRVISRIPTSQRTPAMLQFASTFWSVIANDQLLRYEYSIKPTTSTYVQQYDPGLYATQNWVQDWTYDATTTFVPPDPSWHSMSDNSLWLVGGTAEILGANANDPTLVPLTSTEISNLQYAIQQGLLLFKHEGHSHPQTQNFSGQAVGSVSYFDGDGQNGADEEYAGYTGQLFPLSSASGPQSSGTDPVITTWSVSPSTIQPGGSATLSWATQNSVNNCSSLGCTSSQSGSITVTPSSTTTYQITATNSAGITAAATTTLTVSSTAPVITTWSVSPPAILQGASATLSWATQNSVNNCSSLGCTASQSGSVTVTPSSTTSYTITATSSAGTTSSETVTLNVAVPVVPYARVPTVSWDISHYTRVPIMLRSLFDNAKAYSSLTSGYPQYTDIQQAVNQLIYVVMQPQGAQTYGPVNPGPFSLMFNNYMDGSNGWFRVGYNGNPNEGYSPAQYCNSQTTAANPLCLTNAAQPGVWGYLSAFNPDLASVQQAFIALAQAKDPASVAFANQYYYYAGSNFSFTDSNGLEQHPASLMFLVNWNSPFLR